MGGHKTSIGLMVTGIIFLFVLTLFCSHFNIGQTGGMTLSTSPTAPTTWWDAAFDGVSWFTDAATFQLTDVSVNIGYIIWIITVVFIIIPVVYLIRGTS